MPAPAAFESPVDHRLYCAWVENPYECDGSGYDPAPFAMPSNDLDRTTQGVSENFDLLDALLLYHITYHSYINNEWYYNNVIAPAWSAHPGTYYQWGGHPVVHETNVTFYVTNSRSFDNRYHAREVKSASSARYRTKTGKVYNGKTVPTKKFAGTNAKPGNQGKGKAGTKPQSRKTGERAPRATPRSKATPRKTGAQAPRATPRSKATPRRPRATR